jgi:hypothetical protein
MDTHAGKSAAAAHAGGLYLAGSLSCSTTAQSAPPNFAPHAYEGDTLVVDTVGIDERTWVDGFGTPHTNELHVIERFQLIEDGKVLEANVHVEDPGAFTAPWNAIQRFRQYEAAVRQVGIARIAQLASAPEGPLTELICADNPNSFFPGTSALPLPQALAPDF